MPNLYAHSEDGYVRMTHAGWANARDAASGNSSSSSGTVSSIGTSAYASAGRGGGTTYFVQRSFFYFNTSAITTDVQSATFKVYGAGNTSGDLIAVKSNLGIATLGTADFDAIEGWDTSTGADGSGAGDQESNVTKYSNEKTSWAVGYNDIPLNGTAKNDMRTLSTVYLCLINYDYDLKDVDPASASDNKNGIYYSNYTGTSRDPYIEYTLDPGNNGLFFGANF